MHLNKLTSLFYEDMKPIHTTLPLPTVRNLCSLLQTIKDTYLIFLYLSFATSQNSILILNSVGP